MPNYKRHHFPNPFDPLIPDTAWVLGLWYTDGSVENDCAYLSQKERATLEKVKNIISPPNDNERVRICPDHQSLTIRVFSRDLVEHLSEQGVMPCKSRVIEFPQQIPATMLPHFIRGVWDGDGYIGTVSSEFRITCASGSQRFIEGIVDVLYLISGYKPTIYKQKHVQCYTVSLYASNAKGFCNWMYADSSDANRITRKYEAYMANVSTVFQQP